MIVTLTKSIMHAIAAPRIICGIKNGVEETKAKGSKFVIIFEVIIMIYSIHIKIAQFNVSLLQRRYLFQF